MTLLFLFFADPPTIIESSPSVVAVKAGEDVTLKCNATGYPSPTIRWYKYSETGDRQGSS